MKNLLAPLALLLILWASGLPSATAQTPGPLCPHGKHLDWCQRGG